MKYFDTAFSVVIADEHWWIFCKILGGMGKNNSGGQFLPPKVQLLPLNLQIFAIFPKKCYFWQFFSQKCAILDNFPLLKVKIMGKFFHNFFAVWEKIIFFVEYSPMPMNAIFFSFWEESRLNPKLGNYSAWCILLTWISQKHKLQNFSLCVSFILYHLIHCTFYDISPLESK